MTADGIVPTPSTRVATEGDLEVLRSLIHDAADSVRDARGGALMLTRETPFPDDAALRSWVTDASHRVLLGLLDDAPVGVAAAHYDTNVATVDALWVEEGARSVGLGEALLNAVIDWAREQGCSVLDAYALPGERITKNFFEAAGMKTRVLTVSRRLDDAAT